MTKCNFVLIGMKLEFRFEEIFSDRQPVIKVINVFNYNAEEVYQESFMFENQGQSL